MGPVEFIKSCFAIACVMLFFVIFIKVSFALVDWLVERDIRIERDVFLTITYGVFRIRKRILRKSQRLRRT